MPAALVLLGPATEPCGGSSGWGRDKAGTAAAAGMGTAEPRLCPRARDGVDGLQEKLDSSRLAPPARAGGRNEVSFLSDPAACSSAQLLAHPIGIKAGHPGLALWKIRGRDHWESAWGRTLVLSSPRKFVYKRGRIKKEQELRVLTQIPPHPKDPASLFPTRGSQKDAAFHLSAKPEVAFSGR